MGVIQEVAVEQEGERERERERESGFGLRESADSVVFLGCAAGASLQQAVKIEEERRGVQLGSCSLQKA